MQTIVNRARYPGYHTETERVLVQNLANIGFVSWAETPFRLKSGGLSRVYVNGRSELTDAPTVLEQIACIINKTAWSLFNELVPVTDRGSRRPCLIGIPTAGTPLAIAAGQYGSSKLPTRIMREKPKDYGNSRGWVEGAPNPDKHLYMTIDNVVTDGGSKFETIERLRVDGYPIDEMVHIILVDRGQGGVEQLRAAGHKVEVIFNLIDLVRAFGERKHWPLERVQAVEEELAGLTAA